MKKYYVLFNPLSGNKRGEKRAEKLKEILNDGDLQYINIKDISSYETFFGSIQKEDDVILCGGDGTINRFVNQISNMNIENNIYYYATGTGNDFLNDIGKKDDTICLLNDYIKDLPVATIKGTDYKFLNAIGYGIDGYCCEIGDKIREKSDKKINYASIVLKGLLFHYKPTNARIIVDGKEYKFKKVWIAPTMYGRYYGGGMKAAPNQDRLSPEKTLSAVVMHGSGKLKSLIIMPFVPFGKHERFKKNVTILTGKEITVEFDRPTSLQVDGETILDVTEYHVKSQKKDLINV